MATPVINKNLTLDFSAMTLAQLHDEAVRLAAVLELCNAQRREIWRLCEQRKALVVSQARIAELTDIEKDALRTVLG